MHKGKFWSSSELNNVMYEKLCAHECVISSLLHLLHQLTIHMNFIAVKLHISRNIIWNLGEIAFIFYSLLQTIAKSFYHDHFFVVSHWGIFQVQTKILICRPSQSLSWTQLSVHDTAAVYNQRQVLFNRGSFMHKFLFCSASFS